MDNDIVSKYNDFLEIEGDVLTKFRKIGYIPLSYNGSGIGSIEEFKSVLSECNCISKEKFRTELKKIYRNHINSKELNAILEMGDLGFKKNEVFDALRILPLNEDDSISVDDLVDFIYK